MHESSICSQYFKVRINENYEFKLNEKKTIKIIRSPGVTILYVTGNLFYFSFYYSK